jgi:hypothetical protein
MSSTLERFEHFLIARSAKGEPLELSRSKSELVMLAFDSQMKRLVELRVVKDVGVHESAHRRSAKERALMASELRAPSFARVLTVGDDEGIVYYTTSLSDGELVADYVGRRGALPAATAFCLLLHLLEDLVQLQSYHRLIAKVSLSRLLVTTLEDTFLQLRVSDFGLAEREERSEGDLKRLCGEVCELLFLLLTGQEYCGQSTDAFPALTCLPSSLRSTLRNTLADRNNSPAILEKLRDEVREAFSAMVSNLQVRNTRKHLVINSEALLPKSNLQTLLLEDVPVSDLLRGAIEADESEGAQRYPFTLPASSTKDGQKLTVHLLPADRIVPHDQYEAVPLQMWRLDPKKHPNILRSMSVWESPDWTFLTEEREPGFPLSRLIAERIVLNPAEVLVLMKQVKAGVEQAEECGVFDLDLHPSNIVLRVGKQGPMQSREFEKLMLKRVDSWPSFILKLRPHATMRGLYEQLLVDVPTDRGEHDSSLHPKDACRRSFVALAVYMLTGQRQVGRQVEFPETVSPPLADYLRSCLEVAKRFGKSPSPEEFLKGFESLVGTSGEEESFAARYRGTAVMPVAEMESVGSVSDFDEDADAWGDPVDTAMPAMKRPQVTQRLLAGPQPLDLGRPSQRSKGMVGMVLWGVVCLVLGIFVITLFAGDNSAHSGMPPDGEAVKRDIRRALIPTAEELEEFHKKQAGTVESTGVNQGQIADVKSRE